MFDLKKIRLRKDSETTKLSFGSTIQVQCPQIHIISIRSPPKNNPVRPNYMIDHVDLKKALGMYYTGTHTHTHTLDRGGDI